MKVIEEFEDSVTVSQSKRLIDNFTLEAEGDSIDFQSVCAILQV